MVRQRSTNQRTNSNYKAGGNFSEQKTPNAPNSFLYRAHINLNELSSAQQEEYNAHVTQQANKVS
jgi:hypothetical protein